MPLGSRTETDSALCGSSAVTGTSPERSQASGLKTRTGTPSLVRVSILDWMVSSALCGGFVAGPADAVVIALRFLIDDADAGAGGEVVELVEEHLLPGVGEFGGGIVAALQPGERRIFLRVEQPLFALAHVALVVGLGGEDAAVVFEIELVLPGGDGHFAGGWSGQLVLALGHDDVVPGGRVGVDLFFDRGEVGLRDAELVFGHDFVGVAPVIALVEDGAGRAAAVVADAVEVHHVGHAGRAFARDGEVSGEADRVEIVVGVVMREVGEHLAAVGRFPPEELEGELVGVVPGHLLGDEVVESGALVDLRELPVVAEGVGVPADAGGDAVEVLEGGLADEQLADERFAVGHVEVGLDPHAADDLPAALGDALLDLGVEGWIFVGHPLVVLRGGLGVGVVRILVHQLRGGAEGALDDVDGLRPRPEPRGIDVGVAGEVKGRLA